MVEEASSGVVATHVGALELPACGFDSPVSKDHYGHLGSEPIFSEPQPLSFQMKHILIKMEKENN